MGGKFSIAPSDDKSFFIDRDGTHFGAILNFLRSGHLIVDDCAVLRQKLLLEAKFYQLQPLIRILQPKVDSVILSAFHIKVLESWIAMEWLRSKNESVSESQKSVHVPKLNFRLLFRASKHGFSAAAFHRRCDHKKNTLCVISANATIFGGFTSIAWEPAREGRAVDQIAVNTKSTRSPTFAFFLECASDVWRAEHRLLKSEKWHYCGADRNGKGSYARSPCYSVYHHRSYGPVFGYRPCFDYDGEMPAHLVVGDECDKKLTSRIDSFVGEHLSVRKHMTDSFFVSDYEVFHVTQS